MRSRESNFAGTRFYFCGNAIYNLPAGTQKFIIVSELKPFFTIFMNASLIAKQFEVNGQLVSAVPYGSGNINDTYHVIFRTSYSERRFILQRIRKNVFPQPSVIMDNMRVVTDICHAKLKEINEDSDRIWQLPKIIQTHDGKDFYEDANGDLWRAITYIASVQSFETVQSGDHAYEAGTVLGFFHNLINDIPVKSLGYVIEGFHITPNYLEQLDAVKNSKYAKELLAEHREARTCMRFIEERRDFIPVFENAKAAGTLKLHPTHGDPKVGNILIDEATGKGTSIIDLDTIQPGLIHADIGDAVRSACNPAGEDAGDLSSVRCDVDLFASIWRGYKRHAKKFLSEVDYLYVYDAIRILPLELGLRFFADYLNGDTYFKTKYNGHNLKRALVQFKLVESIENHESQIRKIIGV